MIVLIDFENTHQNGLEGYWHLESCDTVLIYYSDQNSGLPRACVEYFRKKQVNVQLIRLKTKRDNALDMYIASSTGMFVGQYDKICIVSKDKGYLAVKDFWSLLGETEILLGETIEQCILHSADTQDFRVQRVKAGQQKLNLAEEFDRMDLRTQLNGMADLQAALERRDREAKSQAFAKEALEQLEQLAPQRLATEHPARTDRRSSRRRSQTQRHEFREQSADIQQLAALAEAAEASGLELLDVETISGGQAGEEAYAQDSTYEMSASSEDVSAIRGIAVSEEGTAATSFEAEQSGQIKRTVQQPQTTQAVQAAAASQPGGSDVVRTEQKLSASAKRRNRRKRKSAEEKLRAAEREEASLRQHTEHFPQETAQTLVEASGNEPAAARVNASGTEIEQDSKSGAARLREEESEQLSIQVLAKEAQALFRQQRSADSEGGNSTEYVSEGNRAETTTSMPELVLQVEAGPGLEVDARSSDTEETTDMPAGSSVAAGVNDEEEPRSERKKRRRNTRKKSAASAENSSNAISETDTVKPETTKPEADKAEIKKSEASNSETAKSETAQTGTIKTAPDSEVKSDGSGSEQKAANKSERRKKSEDMTEDKPTAQTEAKPASSKAEKSSKRQRTKKSADISGVQPESGTQPETASKNDGQTVRAGSAVKSEVSGHKVSDDGKINKNSKASGGRDREATAEQAPKAEMPQLPVEITSELKQLMEESRNLHEYYIRLTKGYGMEQGLMYYRASRKLFKK